MSTGLARASLLLSLLAASACSKPYSGPVSVTPTDRVTAPVSAYVPVYALVYSGGSPAPMILDHFTVRCVDPSVCATALVPGDRGAEGRVAGLKVGESDVVVAFQHPVNDVAGEAHFHVRFVAAGGESLAVGNVMPPDTYDDQMLLTREVPGAPAAQVLSCHHDIASPLRDRGPAYMAALVRNAFFACEPALEVVPGQQHLCLSSRMQNRWNHLEHTEEVLVCASLRDGRIAGLRYYGSGPTYDSIALGDKGAVDDAQCPRVTAPPAAP